MKKKKPRKPRRTARGIANTGGVVTFARADGAASGSFIPGLKSWSFEIVAQFGPVTYNASRTRFEFTEYRLDSKGKIVGFDRRVAGPCPKCGRPGYAA